MSEYFIEVNEIPKRANYSHPSICSIIIDEFLKSKVKIVKLNTKNIPLKTPYENFRGYIKDNKISNIKVFQRGLDIYLLRTDIWNRV